MNQKLSPSSNPASLLPALLFQPLMENRPAPSARSSSSKPLLSASMRHWPRSTSPPLTPWPNSPLGIDVPKSSNSSSPSLPRKEPSTAPSLSTWHGSRLIPQLHPPKFSPSMAANDF
ncbi:unnamed protein product [Belladonna mottle virus]|uniref:VP virion protein and ORF n=1 Tax=Belladonna mottle virus TaxID=12149 RepID=Q65666_BMDV|nr:unnamed protein product [Belladonna mottle virus]CAA38395.1 unnamed protein product [Belladonna mottle virus]